VRHEGFVVKGTIGHVGGKGAEIAYCEIVGQFVDTADNHDGLRIEHADGAWVHHNVIHGVQGKSGNSVGIKVYKSQNLVVEDNANYWESWYLGYEFDRAADKQRKPGVPSEGNPRTGAYKRCLGEGRDLHELHALMAPRPFLVSGGAQDRPEHWTALNHAIALNEFLGQTGRVAMTMRDGHTPTPESNAQVYTFLEHFLEGH